MYHLIVDTENYAGDFARDLTYYTTGCMGDCHYSSPLVEQARKDMRYGAWWAEHLVEQSMPGGRAQIATMAETPHWFNDGYGRMYRIDDGCAENITTRCAAYLSVRLLTDELPPPEVWDEFQERVIDFCEHVFPTSHLGRQRRIVLTGVRQEHAPKPKRKRNI